MTNPTNSPNHPSRKPISPKKMNNLITPPLSLAPPLQSSAHHYHLAVVVEVHSPQSLAIKLINILRPPHTALLRLPIRVLENESQSPLGCSGARPAVDHGALPNQHGHSTKQRPGLNVVVCWVLGNGSGDRVDIQCWRAAGLGDDGVGGKGDAEGAAVGADGAGETD